MTSPPGLGGTARPDQSEGIEEDPLDHFTTESGERRPSPIESSETNEWADEGPHSAHLLLATATVTATNQTSSKQRLTFGLLVDH